MSVTVQTRTLRLVRTSVEWASDNPELPDRVQGFDSTLRRYKMGNGVDAWSSLPWWSDETVTPLQVTQNIPSGDPAPYTLTSPQLATINSMGRYPIFGAYIGGVNFPDITVDYDGSPGSFTAATVNLHQDGGLNLDTTFIQFT